MTRHESPARVAQRSLVATVEITVAASLAHVLAGGHLPGFGFLLAFAGLVFGCSWLAIGRVLRLRVVVPFVLAAQVGLHLALDAVPATVPVSGHAGHAGHAVAEATEAALVSGSVLGLTPLMLWAHLVTALVTAVLLLLQERLLVAVASSWSRLPMIGVVPRWRPLRATARALVRPTAMLVCLTPRRGPPAGLCAAP